MLLTNPLTEVAAMLARESKAALDLASLQQEGEAAERQYRFLEAYSLYMQLAIACEGNRDWRNSSLALLRAVTCLEKTQDSRGVLSGWEYLGNQIGKQLHVDAPFSANEEPGQSRLFFVMSWKSWLAPEHGYYRSDEQAIARHQQAWAYTFGAREAATGSRHGNASALFRKAALAWERSAWGDRTADQDGGHWTPELLDQFRGDKWQQAARCYYEAASNELKEFGGVLQSYRAGHMLVGKEHAPLDDGYRGGDLDRMLRAWRRYQEIKPQSEEAFTEMAFALRSLQDQLARAGRRSEAIRLYRERQTIEWQRLHGVRRWFRIAYHIATGSGSSLPRSLCTVVILLVLVFPCVFLSIGLMSAPTGGTPTLVGFGDAVLFSVSNAVGGATTEYSCGTLGGRIAQTGEAALAYFAMGYLMWVVLRSFEE